MGALHYPIKSQTIKIMSGKALRLPNSANPAKQMPILGLGTWQGKKHEVGDAVETALKAGYKHIDAAAIYGNEAEVGEGIKKSGVDRDSIWITSKLWNNSHKPEEVSKALDKTISDLGVGYLDLYLMHWPSAFASGGDMIPKENGVAVRDNETTLAQTWAEMEKALEAGKVKNIGLSNFTKSEVEEVLRTAKHKPDAMQIELHPYLQQTEFVEWLQSKGIEVTAYSPLGAQNPIYGSKNLAKEDPVIVEIAEKYGKTPVQIILSWGATRNTIVIPKSTNAERIQQNLDIIELSGDDMAKIAALDKGLRLNDPSTTFNYVFFADEKPAYKTALDAITNAGKAAKAGIQSAVGQKS